MNDHPSVPRAARRLTVVIAGVLAVSGAALAMQMRSGAEATTDLGERLVTRLASARGGETITLTPGDYGKVEFPKQSYRPAVRIVANGARFSAMVLRDLEGVSIIGGTVAGPGGRSYGITLQAVKNVSIEGMTITGAHRGIVLGRSDGVTISGNRLTGLLSDGLDIANASHITVRNNICRDFSPTATTFDGAGNRLTVGDHPDCIQAWSRPSAAPTSDVIVENNDIEGRMQGVFFGNHVRNGVDDGGFDRIVIRGNRILIDHPNGIVLAGGRNSIVTGNQVSTLPNSFNSRRPGTPTRTMLRVNGGADNRVCGNSVADFPGSPATSPCR